MLHDFLQWSLSHISFSLESAEFWLSNALTLLPIDNFYRDLVVVAHFEELCSIYVLLLEN